MNRPRDDAAGRSHERAIRLFATFLTMVIAEWRELVAEVSHASPESEIVAGRTNRRAAFLVSQCLSPEAHQ
jgi:selenocysteine lyase/cysteine desulfurase